MKRLVVIVVVLGVIAFASWQWLDRKAKDDATQKAWDAAEQETQERVEALIARTNAIANWEAELTAGEDFRLSPVMTMEIERLWLTPRPIFFMGTIKDITSLNSTHYEVTVERTALASMQLLMTDLELALVAPKEQIDNMLAENPDLLGNANFFDSVAFVGLIRSVEVRQVADEQGETDEIKVGRGELLGAEYVGMYDIEIIP